jgi:hypothetical protein
MTKKPKPSAAHTGSKPSPWRKAGLGKWKPPFSTRETLCIAERLDIGDIRSGMTPPGGGSVLSDDAAKWFLEFAKMLGWTWPTATGYLVLLGRLAEHHVLHGKKTPSLTEDQRFTVPVLQAAITDALAAAAMYHADNWCL